MTMKFKECQPAEWESQAGGFTTKKQGFVVHVVPAGALLPDYYAKRLKTPGTPRDHESYIMEAEDSRGDLRYYWPKVSALRPLPPGSITMTQAQLLRRAQVKEQQKARQAKQAAPTTPKKAAPAMKAQPVTQKPAAKAKPSGIEAMVCLDITRRQQLGIAKYGVTVASNPLELKAWLQHAYEETLDKAVYLRRAIEEIDSTMKGKKA